MEVVLIIVLIAGSVVFKLRKRRIWRKHTQSTRGRSRKSTTVRRQPFDVNSARPPFENAVLEGPVYVVDGDTIVIRKTQIRLFGVDAPEIDHPFGNKAKWALVSLCKGQTVRAEVMEQDSHGRTVARCYLHDGRDLSAEMVKLGLALDWPKFSGGEYCSLEMPDARKKLWLAAARQRGHMHVWQKFEARRYTRETK